MIKSQFMIIALSILGYTVFSQNIKGDSWEKVKSAGSGTLNVVYIEQFGLISKDKNGDVKGICVDILSDFSKFIKEKYDKTVNIKYTLQLVAFADFLKAVQHTPNLLGVTNTTITEERTKIYKFSPPFMHNHLVLLTHNEVPAILHLNELQTKFSDFTAQVIGGSTHVEYIAKIKNEHMPSLKITYGSDGPTVIKNLVANHKLFTVIDLTEFIDAVRQHLPVKRHPADVGIVEELGFIMSKESDWDEPFKEFLTEDYLNSTRYRQIVAQNISSTFLTLMK